MYISGWYVLCRAGYVKIGANWCVMMILETSGAAISWTASDTFCRQSGGSLITVETEEKWQAVWEFINAFGGNGKKFRKFNL